MPTGLEIAAWGGLKKAGSAIWANPVARWIVLIFTGLVLHRIWLAFRDRRRDKAKEQEIELKAEKTARKVVSKAKEKADETVKKAEEARADIPRGAASGELPERVQNVLFLD